MEDVIMTTPVYKCPSTPLNVKQDDSLLNKKEWTRSDCVALDGILQHYEETYFNVDESDIDKSTESSNI